MASEAPKKNSESNLPKDDLKMAGDIKRRDFLKYTAGAFACMSMGSWSTLAFASGGDTQYIVGYPIDSTVVTTSQRMLSFPLTLSPVTTNLLPAPPANPKGGPGLGAAQLSQVSQYSALGYGDWNFGAPLPVVQRTDIMPGGYNNPNPKRKIRLAKFFSISDIHITDKEAPNQFIYLQQFDVHNSGQNTSIYSPVMMYTTHVLDAAIQTVNALHKQDSFDFGISLGDTCNNTSYNELRWYIDVFDGKVITPSSGAHLGADNIEYQKPYKAAGLDKSIPWYQAMGNHDHFYIGSFPVDANPALGIRESYVSDTVWASSALLVPNLKTFPSLFNMENLPNKPAYYMGLLDGATPYGEVINAGAVTSDKFKNGAPKVAADPDRRSLRRTEWIREYFNTSTQPVGHGLNLVDPAQKSGFACYSFLPKSDLPLKMIVLDDTQSETDGSTDIHGHGYLDADRWAWLKAELAAGQAANQLMIIAAHVPIAVSAIGSETEWWLGDKKTTPENRNAVTLAELVQTLQNTPNLLMWMSGHRHLNTVKAFISPDPNKPEQGFWQVETSSLRDFPQQLRTFEIYINSDYSVSIVTVNVDPAVAEGTPAATSRKYAIAVEQIIQTNLNPNMPNVAKAGGVIPVPSMDPTRPQGTPTSEKPLTDPSIQTVDLSKDGVPYHASYNAELFKQLSPEMTNELRKRFSAAGRLS